MQDIDTVLPFYEALIEKIELGIHVIDSKEKTVIYNKKMMEIEGMNIEDVLDKNILEVFQFDPAEESTLLQVLQTGESIQNVKQTYLNNKGEEITTINHTYPIRKEGLLIGAVEIAKDVTKLEKMIQENILKKGGTNYTFDSIITNSPVMKELIETGKRATRTNSSVLIIGESGTGKELFAQSIHNGSPRSDQPFISQNCAALPSALLESLLFGTEKNEESGEAERPGLFEQADSGTLLLDEIDSLTPDLQSKLLRIIQEKKVQRIGGTEEIPINIRIMATISEDPIDAISAGKLRKDLFYRLSVVSIFLPPLRDRKDDIKPLVSFFIEKYNHLFGMNVKKVDKEIHKLFLDYEWPGNVRQLDHTIEGAMNLMEHETTMTFNHLPIQFRNQMGTGFNKLDLEKIEGFLYQQNKAILPLEDYIQEAETYYIKKSLQHHEGNITKTAKALGMSRQNLQYRIRKYNIVKEGN